MTALITIAGVIILWLLGVFVFRSIGAIGERLQSKAMFMVAWQIPEMCFIWPVALPFIATFSLIQYIGCHFGMAAERIADHITGTKK